MRPVRGSAELALNAAGISFVIAMLALTGCGGSDQPPQGADVGVGVTAGPRVEVFTCEDWNRANPQTRFSTVAKIRDVVGGQVTGTGVSGTGTVLDDEVAYDFFDQYCEQDLARHFLLYKLYGRAAGFAGQSPDE